MQQANVQGESRARYRPTFRAAHDTDACSRIELVLSG
jgi:hypothetical protein